ncbi:sensor domain-containing diguanylate cyclase [Thiorhodococcus minor]|uniref:diguanylate cyclase n=1 Tax=Thiorhodococcus minor TaxID=57489 RepID=A0A6M0JWP1_9GAMM|nr:sensor domain-containing diguanylate cyclase [Thiorhodococcus minor]NEV61946.1 diguanylate cyclase [Thiorhodococcus minor]
MKAIKAVLPGGRLFSLRTERNLALIFGLLGLLLVGTITAHWLLVLEPALREEAASRAAAMAQAHAQSLERVLGSGLPAPQLERELRTTMGSLLLLKDEATQKPFVRRLSISLDYDLVDMPRGSLDLSMGPANASGCFVLRVPLYDPRTHLLIGVATFHSNAFFMERLVGDLRTKLWWIMGIIAGLTGFAWLESSRLLKRLGESEANLRRVFEAAPFPMVLGEQGMPSLRQANEAAKAYLGLREDATGRLTSDVWLRLYAQGLPKTLGAQHETCLSVEGGPERWALVSATPLRFSGTMSRLVTLVDVSELKAVQEELRAASQTDALTGLYNRRFLYQRLAKEIELVQRYSHPLSIVLFDLDYFKGINDTFGHRAGDEVLVRVAEVLRRCLREVDIAGRYGGEELLLLLPHSSVGQAREAAERIRIALKHEEWPYQGMEVTLSAGVSQYAGETLDAFIDSADRKLYRIKANGRDGVAC